LLELGLKVIPVPDAKVDSRGPEIIDGDPIGILVGGGACGIEHHAIRGGLRGIKTHIGEVVGFAQGVECDDLLVRNIQQAIAEFRATHRSLLESIE
jgi:hypothetical protein